jgi:hypothetical protein
MRAVMTVGALLVGGGILRAPSIRIGSRASQLGDAREESAYLLGKTPVSFPLAAGARTLRLLFNFDLPAASSGPPASPGPFSVRVRITPDGRDETFALMAVEADGASAFYLDSARRPSRTALLGIERDRDAGGTLEVALVGPPRAAGAVRLLNLEKRALGTAERAWAAVPAFASERRRLYFERVTPPGAPPAPLAARGSDPRVGRWLAPGRAAAWTVVGPTTLTLSVEEGELRGRADLLAADGASTDGSVSLAPGRSLSWTIGPGPATLRLTSTVAARVAISGSVTAAGTLARAVPLADGRIELDGRSVVVEAARSEPEASAHPVVFTLADRPNDEPLRVDVRALMRDEHDTSPAIVRWRVLGDSRRELARGTSAEPVRAAPEDGVGGSSAWLAEPTSFYVWPPVGAADLELTSERALEVTAASPAWADERDGDGSGDEAERRELGLAATLRLRHGPPPARRRYFGVSPANVAALRASARVDRLILAPRLEHVAPPVSVAAQALPPAGHPPRVEMLVPDASTATLPTQVWALAPGREAVFASSGGSATVLYAADTSDAGGAISVTFDGRVVAAAPLYAARGQLTIAAPSGEHRVRVDLPASARAFLNRPVVGARRLRRVALYGVETGRPLRFQVDKSADRHVVGVVLYGRGLLAPDAALTITIDRGTRRRRGFVSHDRTALERTAAVRASPLGGATPLNTDVAPTWVSEPIFLTLGDDLTPRAHDLAVTLRGATGPIFIRVFGHAVDGTAGTSAPGPLAWDLGT